MLGQNREEGELPMGLFGEHCDRCGEKTRQKVDDTPICKKCQEEMALLVEAGKENRRCCPVDGAAMEKSIAHMIVIDRCPKCHGVWLDGGELEKVTAEISTDAIVAMSHGLAFRMG